MNRKILKVILLILVLFYGCRKEFGEKMGVSKFTPVLNLKKYPKNYLNKMVKVKGKVVEDSSLHLWVTIQDEHIIIMIKLDKLKKLRSLINKNIIVEGQFVMSKDGYCMIARWLKIE